MALMLPPCCAAADESESPLADAAERGNLAAVRALLDQHADVNAAQVDGMTALHWAVQRDDVRMAALLIGAGADVRAENRYGVAPMSIACVNGNEALEGLLQCLGADPNTTLPGGETALMSASRTGDLATVAALLRHGAVADARDENGQTALMWASAEGHADVVRALIEAKADFRTPLDSGFTPLLFAVREGHAEAVHVLLEAGADVNEATRPKRTPLGGPGKGVSPLVMAIENGHFELAAALLDAGADANDGRSGMTPLHIISRVRKADSGDETGQPEPEGSGNLTSLEMVRRLVAHGAEVNARLRRGDRGPGKLARQGATPFLLAADTADVPLMRLLVELGADPSIPNAEHSTALMAAAGLGTLAPGEEAGTEAEALEAAALALELGGDVNAVDDNGETAMHGAAYASWPRMVQFLADHEAEVAAWNHKNKHGWTPLLIAQGYRPGNFKPSQETIDALERVLPADAYTAEPPAPKYGYEAP
jgi:uncharacterized protein